MSVLSSAEVDATGEPAPRAKRTYKSADARREQILDCALEVLSQKGYHATSIADICSGAGIGRATLYQYFNDKRDVLRALSDRVASKIIGSLKDREPLRLSAEHLPNPRQALEFMQSRFIAVLGAVFEDVAIARLVLREGRGADGVADELLGQIQTTVLHLTQADMREGQRVGFLRPFDVELVSQFFLGGIESVVLTALDRDGAVDVTAIASEAARLQLLGVLARPPGDPTSL